MRISQEEISGPVGVILPFDTEEEAIALANDTEYGLLLEFGLEMLGVPIELLLKSRQGKFTSIITQKAVSSTR